ENMGTSLSLRTAPRGASLNSDTGAFSWKPDASQVGTHVITVAVTDADGRQSVKDFKVEVYGSTMGDKKEPVEAPPAGGGGGGAAPSEKPDDATNTDKTDTANEKENNESLLIEEKVPSEGEADEVDEVEKPLFTDLSEHIWATDAINALATDGIIRGTSESTFSPANNITRADFALLLVRAFNLKSDNTENFTDVSASDYFAAELAIARNTGIVNGIGENKFAPRNTITRQDMMVIVYRALQNQSLPLEGKVSAELTDEVSYPDFPSVAPYAREAVSALISEGLVNGKNNLIAPLDYTTRAEVAVLIRRILDYTQK
ncbi:MAG: S-layer homology domain-containing protein, partial [Oscillospiraceae bacterium]|nr:S-layer homology domain-containing protein [Oscillospiraceae bacterium]